MSNQTQPSEIWKVNDYQNKRILFVCERVKAIEILSLFLGNSLSQAVKEISTVNYMSPSSYSTPVNNPDHPNKESQLRLDLTMLSMEMGNMFQMARNYGYGGTLLGKFWGVLTTADSEYDIMNAWPWLVSGLESIKR